MKTLTANSAAHGDATAVFSDDMVYRYTLTRRCGPGDTLHFCMLKPSTADHERLDPTVLRCRNRAVALGYGALTVTNLFAYRATRPHVMLAEDDPIGPRNDEAIRLTIRQAPMTVCAWGTHGTHLGRADAVLRMLDVHAVPLDRLYRIGPPNKGGTPKHPLFCKMDTEIVRHP